jgi:site-specific DNA recombinase
LERLGRNAAAVRPPGADARDALNRRFDVVLAESMDRFSRDQEDTAGLFKRLTSAGVNIVTLAEGDITPLHIGFRGTMNALFLNDLAETVSDLEIS